MPGRFPLLLVLFVLSGGAGLIYQTAWVQLFTQVFGASSLAVAAVLAAYMAGLALGAGLASRWLRRVRRPVVVYAVLELGIAVSALAVPAILRLAGAVQVAWLSGAEGPEAIPSAFFYLVASFLILLVPTTLMGATLPILVRYGVRRVAEIGSRVGLLYTANTFGSAGGTLLTAFVLLPRFGLDRATLTAAALNGLAALGAFVLVRSGTQTPELESASAVANRRATGPPWILPLILISGTVSFTYEILWTRLLTFILGGSIYAFATMLATFLVGLALGSAIAARYSRSLREASRGFALVQLFSALCFLAAFRLADRLPTLMEGQALAGGFIASAAALLPGAVCIGATFPLAVRILAHKAEEAAVASARVLVWNTLGAIVGAVGCGSFLLPAAGFSVTLSVAVGLSLALALSASLLTRPRHGWLAGAAVSALVAMSLWPPATPWRLLQHRADLFRPASAGMGTVGDVVYYGVGRHATILLREDRGAWRLTSDGLPEALIRRPGAPPGREAVARWLSLLPVAFRPDLSSLMVIGLGAGVSVEEIPETIDAVDVVELESEVVRAARSVAAERRRDPLADPRLRLHLDDARSFLRLGTKRYDAIVSQPSHPWTAGASHLFTRELFALAEQRLEPGGIFVQWIGLTFVDAGLLRSLTASLLDVFEHVELFQPPPGGALLFVASQQPLHLEQNALDVAAASWADLGIRVVEDLYFARFADTEGARRLAAGAPLNTDGRNFLQSFSPRIHGHALGEAGMRRLIGPYDPLPRDVAKLDRRYVVRALIRQGSVARARRVASTLADPSWRLGSTRTPRRRWYSASPPRRASSSTGASCWAPSRWSASRP